MLRKAGLRLDDSACATSALESGQRAIVPGKLEESELIARIVASDPSEAMPPAETGKRLTAAEIDVLRQWVAAGAKYAKHWAYVKPELPPLPPMRDTAWLRNEIDHFVLARLEAEGLAPSAEADRATLIRRVSIDLVGLPPTPEEVERFCRRSRTGRL